mgnify:CR=1 FL=1
MDGLVGVCKKESSRLQVKGLKLEVNEHFDSFKLHLHFPRLPGVLVKVDEPDPLWRDFVHDLFF